ncbi:hypothetical protein Sme01_27740 [Sphaerisporangium melleum]|uniref:Uncharacterized protein n=1 Tax=Sphaerisporangium melleum TaxID=321316 RepID=A0A917VFT5_9ACTN|nr:hypothetical protein [Sphaerisporangium melleum]GGK70352.1 hypothetical protein GCM10007964_11610 [Sphaerisporangium melleum]GII70298.1 hypothetical protein Sme01_27740 [Sphaerisporangium melleum]
MTNLLIILAATALLAVIASRYGADTRDGRDWQPTERFPAEVTSLRHARPEKAAEAVPAAGREARRRVSTVPRKA